VERLRAFVDSNAVVRHLEGELDLSSFDGDFERACRGEGSDGREEI